MEKALLSSGNPGSRAGSKLTGRVVRVQPGAKARVERGCAKGPIAIGLDSLRQYQPQDAQGGTEKGQNRLTEQVKTWKHTLLKKGARDTGDAKWNPPAVRMPAT